MEASQKGPPALKPDSCDGFVACRTQCVVVHKANDLSSVSLTLRSRILCNFQNPREDLTSFTRMRTGGSDGVSQSASRRHSVGVALLASLWRRSVGVIVASLDWRAAPFRAPRRVASRHVTLSSTRLTLDGFVCYTTRGLFRPWTPIIFHFVMQRYVTQINPRTHCRVKSVHTLYLWL